MRKIDFSFPFAPSSQIGAGRAFSRQGPRQPNAVSECYLLKPRGRQIAFVHRSELVSRRI